MAAYRRAYDSCHLQADCQEPGSSRCECIYQQGRCSLSARRDLQWKPRPAPPHDPGEHWPAPWSYSRLYSSSVHQHTQPDTLAICTIFYRWRTVMIASFKYDELRLKCRTAAPSCDIFNWGSSYLNVALTTMLHLFCHMTNQKWF